MSVETASEAAVITRADATRTRVMNSEWTADGDGIRAALDGLEYARETYRDVLTRITDPSDAYFELGNGDDAYGRALHLAAADVAEWTDELDRLVPAAEEVAA